MIPAPSIANASSVGIDHSRRDRSVFLILLALYFLILFPILRANRYYNDDMKRALLGRTGWDSNGRPLTNLLMRMLQCYDHAMVDISPLTQIAAVAVLAWIGVLIARRYAIGSPWMAALVAFPIGGQPFFLENLSYKFDALSMSLALLLALLPILAGGQDRRSWWLGVLALFASLSFYQPAINACLIFILLDLVLAQINEASPRQLKLQLLSRLLQTGLAMLIYQLVVGTHLNGWVKQSSEKIHGLSELPLVKKNFVDFYGFVGSSFNEHWWMYFTPLLTLIALFPIATGIRYASKVRLAQPAWIGAILLAGNLLLPLAALACVLGPILFLVKPPIAPRVLVGVGALLSAGLTAMQAALRRWRWSDKWTMSAASMLALGMCSFASAYGNALGEQKNYEDRIATRLADDVADFKTSDSAQAILLDGTAGYSPITEHIAEQFPLIRTLVPAYISAKDRFHTHIFLMYYLSDFDDMRLKTGADTVQSATLLLAKTCQMPATRRTSAYSLFVIDATIVVTFGRAHAEGCASSDAPSLTMSQESLVNAVTHHR